MSKLDLDQAPVMETESVHHSKSYIERVINEEEELNPDKWISEFEEVTKDAKRIQRELLEKILKQNGETEYLKKYGLSASRFDEETFKKCVPLVTYDDIQPYIERIADGDTSSILTTKPVRSFVFSSGTTSGKSKLIPCLEDRMNVCLVSKLTSYAYRSREFPTDEKTSERDLQVAVEKASKHLGTGNVKLVDYTSYGDVSLKQEHYVIFWELDRDCSDNVLQKCCNSLDKAIPDVIYEYNRELKHIRPLELRIVRRGTFTKILELRASVGAGNTTISALLMTEL